MLSHSQESISSKVNVMAWLEFELTYYDLAVQLSSYYATVIHPPELWAVLFLVYILWETFFKKSPKENTQETKQKNVIKYTMQFQEKSFRSKSSIFQMTHS